MAEEMMQEQAQEQQEQTLEQLLAGSPALKQQFDTMLQRSRQSWQQEAAAQQTEAEKLAKMSKDERERYEFDKERKEFQRQRDEFAAQQLQSQMGSELLKRGYSAELAQWITGKDAETSMNNLTTFDNLVKAEVQKHLNGAMRGKAAPTEPQNKVPQDAFLRGFDM